MSMKSIAKLGLAMVALILFGMTLTGPASAADRKAVAGVIEFKGKPTLVISGTKRLETFQVTRTSVTPPEVDPLSGIEIPVYFISEDVNGISVAGDSLPGRCWGDVSVYCRTDGIKTVIAALGGGHDSFLAEKSLQVRADGGPGNDMIFGGNKADLLIGGPGRDSLTGGAGDDVLKGGPGNDNLTGDSWRDAVFFKPYAKPAGRDRIDGGPGNDTIQGGAGADILIGGPGVDTFENNRDRARDRIVGGGGRDVVRDPDVRRRGSRLAMRDQISGIETLYLEFARYRLR